MIKRIWEDKFLMKAKDVVLIASALAAIGSLITFAFKLYSWPLEIKNNIEICKTTITKHVDKYEPKVDQLEKAIIEMREQNKAVLYYLDRMDKRMSK